MPHAKFDDKYPKHPKIRGLSDAAFRLHTSAICFSAEFLLDGRIMRDDVPDLVRRYRPSATAELVDKGLWVDRGAYYEVHDYLDWNDSRDVVEARRTAKAERQARWLAKANATKEAR